MRRWVVGVAVVGLLAAVASGVLLFRGPSPPSGGVLLVVHEGDPVAVVADRLRRIGVIRSALLFRLYARLSGLDRSLQPGGYRFEHPSSVAAVLHVLATGTPRREVTIPEGFTVRQIALLLAEQGFGRAEAFLCLARDPEFLVAAGVPGMQLEGYLFPDTYRLSQWMSPGEILGGMVRRFHERFDVRLHRRAASRGMSVDDVVTLASMIEKETAVPAERPLVAAVFHNRLRRGMPLQSDPTVIYGLPSFSGNLTRADLDTGSPYNTYTRPGLPAGPIANPGLAAIEAALSPADSPYLYFVSRNDGSHVFSATLAEHNRAVAQYQRPASPSR
jgi:UPF0755 protein